MPFKYEHGLVYIYKVMIEKKKSSIFFMVRRINKKY
jgi:hypothetical protein